MWACVARHVQRLANSSVHGAGYPCPMNLHIKNRIEFCISVVTEQLYRITGKLKSHSFSQSANVTHTVYLYLEAFAIWIKTVMRLERNRLLFWTSCWTSMFCMDFAFCFILRPTDRRTAEFQIVFWNAIIKILQMPAIRDKSATGFSLRTSLSGIRSLPSNNLTIFL